MKKFNCFKLPLLLAVILTFVACGDDYYTDDFLRNSDEKLCGYTWVEEETYLNDSGDPELYVHTLYFSRGTGGRGSGREGHEYYRALSGGGWDKTPYRTNSFTFNWEWIDNLEGIRWDYGGGDIVFFENVWVRDYYLSGKLKGIPCAFYKE